MNISSKEIKRSYRDLSSIINDLSMADTENYVNLVKRFVGFINTNKIIYKIVEPLLNYEIEEEKYLTKHTNSRQEIVVPVDIEEHISYVLQFFTNVVTKENFSLLGFLVNHISTSYNDHLDKFNRNIIDPALRELLVKIEDFIEDEVEEKSEYELGEIQIFNIGSVTNQSGNIAIGKNIKINHTGDINEFPDAFAKAILDNGFTLKEVDLLRDDIQELVEILKDKKPDESKLQRIFKKVMSVGGDIMIKILIDLISKPELTSSVIASI